MVRAVSGFIPYRIARSKPIGQAPEGGLRYLQSAQTQFRQMKIRTPRVAEIGTIFDGGKLALEGGVGFGKRERMAD